MRKSKDFFEMCANRDEHIAENWAKTLDCPVIRVDGLKTVEENVAAIKNTNFRLERCQKSSTKSLYDGFCTRFLERFSDGNKYKNAPDFPRRFLKYFFKTY